MELHKDSGQLRVIIDVSYTSADEFIDFIENEQCQFIESLGVDGLKKFEWYVNEETNTATLVEEFDNAEILETKKLDGYFGLYNSKNSSTVPSSENLLVTSFSFRFSKSQP